MSADYLLCRLTLSPEQIAITKEQYDSVVMSRDYLTEIESFEEKFFAVIESYREVEKTIFDVTINNLLYSGFQTSEFFTTGAVFGRHVSSFTSVARLYVETLAKHAKVLGNAVTDDSSIKVILASRYDSSFHYRVMEEIRNYAQHHAFPVHSLSQGGRWNSDRTFSTYSTEFHFKCSSVRGDSRFKKRILQEIENAGGSVELKACVRSYFSDLCEIHTEVRKLFKERQEKAETVIGRWQKTWSENASQPSLTAVAVVKLENGRIDPLAKQAFIDPEVDEYRKHLARKTASLTNMGHRRVGL